MQTVQITNVTHHTNRINEENNDFCGDVEKTFYQTQ